MPSIVNVLQIDPLSSNAREMLEHSVIVLFYSVFVCASCSSMSKRHLKDQSMSLCACCSFPRNYATCMPLPRLKVTQVAALRGFVRGTLLLSRPPGLDTHASSLLVTTVSRGHCWVSTVAAVTWITLQQWPWIPLLHFIFLWLSRWHYRSWCDVKKTFGIAQAISID